MRALLLATALLLPEACGALGVWRTTPTRARSAFAAHAVKKSASEGVQGEPLAVHPLTIDAIPGFWELEEDEDDQSMHTLIYLLPGGSVEFGRTDGPPPSGVVAGWTVDQSSWNFRLRVKRTFEDSMYPYDVERVYEGYMGDAQGLRTVSGQITIPDEGTGEINPGFFMLTNVPELLEDDE
ncbi:hypothetical protein T492DRAFT_946943 [Pavlovales sp. CCMP2436]|nr:hypothetical protein T492DRAFT_946943 [Pavlovales sp. CCMP2436]